MNIQITKPIQGGSVKAISSKSEAHRLLICAALADCETNISCAELSEDILVTSSCLVSLGAKITYVDGVFNVSPIKRNELQKTDNKEYMLDCKESGSSLRFLLPICGALGLSTSFNMEGRLPLRPLDALCNEMTKNGCRVYNTSPSVIHCEGQLNSGIYTLPGDISSQYISGLLLALPLLTNDSIIHVIGPIESRPYIDMTLKTLSMFGIKVTVEDNHIFHIPGKQEGHSKKLFSVGGDWSNAAFWLVAGAIAGSKVTCEGLSLNSKQGDRAIIDILFRFGAKISIGENAVSVSHGKLRGIDIDASNIPDLVPAIAVVASVAYGKTIIRNSKRLRLKESDRLQAITTCLKELGADITEAEDGLIITGCEILSGGTIDSHKDHRIAMMASIASSVCQNNVIIKNADAVNKSYPNFFNDFELLSGEFKEV